MKRCFVVIPAYNEEAVISKVIAKVPKALQGANEAYSVEVLVVSDGSKDKTVEKALAAGAEYVYSAFTNFGLGAAVRFGLKQAFFLGADLAVLIDADDEYPAEEIPEVALPILKQEADYVIGSRFMRRVKGMKMYRKAGNFCFTWLQRLMLRRTISDGQSGFRAFSRGALHALRIIHDYNYAQVLTINLLRQGYRLQEIPINYKVRHTGESFIRWHYVYKVLFGIFREWITPINKRSFRDTPYFAVSHKHK